MVMKLVYYAKVNYHCTSVRGCIKRTARCSSCNASIDHQVYSLTTTQGSYITLSQL